MISFITFLTLAVLTHAFAGVLIKNEDRRWVSRVVLIAWFSLFPLLVLIDLSFPFAGGGDDENYFDLAATPFNSLEDIFDLTKFVGLMEQPGYPWLLSILYQLTGEDLLAYKLLNLALYIMLIPIWYRIGITIESRAFGRAIAVAIFFLTPLWYYVFFLLKDMTIILMQSVFLLGVVQFSRGGSGKGSLLLCLGATLVLIPFRSQLVLVNAAVLMGGVALTMLRHANLRNVFATLIIPLAMSIIVVVAVFAVSSDIESMAAIGITNESRVIGTQAARESVAQYGQSSRMSAALFPFAYLFFETTGLNPKTWTDFNAFSLRGILALPWIFVGVPFFALGLLQLMRADPRSVHSGGIIAAVRSIRFVATPWGGVLIFILMYMAVSWMVGDTTRWRNPDVPAMAAVAVYGWKNLERGARLPVLLFWILLCGSLFLVYYSTQVS